MDPSGAGYWSINRRQADFIEIFGGAVNPETVKPSERVLILFRGEVVLVAPVWARREDVGKHYCAAARERRYFTPSRSTSNISVAPGGITPPAPLAP